MTTETFHIGDTVYAIKHHTRYVYTDCPLCQGTAICQRTHANGTTDETHCPQCSGAARIINQNVKPTTFYQITKPLTITTIQTTQTEQHGPTEHRYHMANTPQTHTKIFHTQTQAQQHAQNKGWYNDNW